MSYLPLYTIFILCIILGTALHLTRTTWLPHLPNLLQDLFTPSTYPSYFRLLPTTTSTSNARNSDPSQRTSFLSDVESGLHSSAFDLSSNITEGDSRGGLDGKAKEEVQRIMRVRKVGFDEARRYLMQERFRKAGVGKDGLPRDPKLVTFG